MAAVLDPQAKITQKGLVGIPRAQSRTFEKNGFLFSADCSAGTGYLIRSGYVRCFLLDSDGRETTTAILGPGHFVGIEVILGRPAHHEFCEALTHVDAWSVPAEDLRQCSSSPRLQGWLLGSIGQRLELALALRRGISLLSAPERADDIQIRLQALSGVDPHLVRQTALAALLQIRPETLARARRRPQHTSRRSVGSADIISIDVGRHVFESGGVVVDGPLPDGSIARVVSGHVELSLTASGSRHVIDEILGPGDLFSFATLVGLPVVWFRAVAVSDGVLDILSADEFLDQLVTTANESEQMVMRLASRLRAIEPELVRATVPDVSERLVDVLRQVATSDGVADSELPHIIPSSWSQGALANRLGVCRETVTRGLASLVRAGVIQRQGRRIVLLSNKHLPADTAVDDGAGPPDSDPPQAVAAMRHHKPAAPAMLARSNHTHAPTIVWLPIGSIDEPQASQNSRAVYREASIAELAQSLCHDGFLQPLCVRRRGERYELVFGVRRFRAAIRAGLSEVPCTIREADEDRAFLLNALENLHREQLSTLARIRTIERLATSGLGVREISRQTGFNPSTISRWLRINRRPRLKQALDEHQIDLAHAVILVDAPESALPDLVACASQMSAAELRRRVLAVKSDAERSNASDRRHVIEALRCLRTVRDAITDPVLIERLRKEADRIAPANPSGAVARDNGFVTAVKNPSSLRSS